MVSGEGFSRTECTRCFAFFPMSTLSRCTQLLTAGHKFHICTVLAIISFLNISHFSSKSLMFLQVDKNLFQFILITKQSFLWGLPQPSTFEILTL